MQRCPSPSAPLRRGVSGARQSSFSHVPAASASGAAGVSGAVRCRESGSSGGRACSDVHPHARAAECARCLCALPETRTHRDRPTLGLHPATTSRHDIRHHVPPPHPATTSHQRMAPPPLPTLLALRRYRQLRACAVGRRRRCRRVRCLKLLAARHARAKLEERLRGLPAARVETCRHRAWGQSRGGQQLLLTAVCLGRGHKLLLAHGLKARRG